MSQANPMSQHGAFWCETHGRWECTKKSGRSKSRCHASALKGLDRCRHHAGEKTKVAKAKGEAISAWSALSGKAVVQPAEAVLGMLQMSWLRVHLYAGLLQEQVARAQADRVANESLGGFVGSDGAPPVGEGEGLVGHTFGAVKDIGIYASGEALRGLTQLEAAERDRCVRFAKVAHDMGIAEQQVRLAEQQGQMLALVVRRVADGLLAALLGLLGQLAPKEGDTAVVLEQFTGLVAETVRTTWPEWMREIVPREFRAIEQSVGAA